MFWQCSAVYVDPRLVTAQRMVVNSAGNELFPRPSFPNDKDGGIVMSHSLDHLQQSFHRFAAEDGLHARQFQNDGFATQPIFGLSEPWRECRSANQTLATQIKSGTC